MSAPCSSCSDYYWSSSLFILWSAFDSFSLCSDPDSPMWTAWAQQTDSLRFIHSFRPALHMFMKDEDVSVLALVLMKGSWRSFQKEENYCAFYTSLLSTHPDIAIVNFLCAPASSCFSPVTLKETFTTVIVNTVALYCYCIQDGCLGLVLVTLCPASVCSIILPEKSLCQPAEPYEDIRGNKLVSLSAFTSGEYTFTSGGHTFTSGWHTFTSLGHTFTITSLSNKIG